MRTEIECVPCILKQAVNTAKRATDDLTLIRKVIKETLAYLDDLSFDQTPAEASTIVYRISERITGVRDPFEKGKHYYNQVALSLFDKLTELVTDADDSLLRAVKIAVTGNIIDLGIGNPFNLEKAVRDIPQLEFAASDYTQFKQKLSGAKSILYLGDNAGEIVFDRILVEELVRRNYQVTFAVHESPIINDATEIDAVEAGLKKHARVISNGTSWIGTPVRHISDNMLKEIEEADLIISKGQGNFETLSDTHYPVFFLLQAKCECVARQLKIPLGQVAFVDTKIFN